MQKTLYTLEICPCFVEGQGLALGRPTRTQREPPSPLPPALRDGHLGFFWFPETASPLLPRGLWTSCRLRLTSRERSRPAPKLALARCRPDLERTITFQTTCTRIWSD